MHDAADVIALAQRGSRRGVEGVVNNLRPIFFSPSTGGPVIDERRSILVVRKISSSAHTEICSIFAVSHLDTAGYRGTDHVATDCLGIIGAKVHGPIVVIDDASLLEMHACPRIWGKRQSAKIQRIDAELCLARENAHMIWINHIDDRHRDRRWYIARLGVNARTVKCRHYGQRR